MKFYIQTNSKEEVIHDFSWALIESLKYLNWVNSEQHEYIRIDDLSCIPSYHPDQVPVGSVEFVLDYMKRAGVPLPEPINVPDELMRRFAGRKIFNIDTKDSSIDSYGIYEPFIKSRDIIKPDQIYMYSVSSTLQGRFQISEQVRIDSEYRVFVYRGQIVGIQNYSGDFSVFPDMNEIKEMVKAYIKAPIAYTLDVGVNMSRLPSTFVIEAHDFFSCGLYGFFRPDIYPFMLYQWYQEYTAKFRSERLDQW